MQLALYIDRADWITVRNARPCKYSNKRLGYVFNSHFIKVSNGVRLYSKNILKAILGFMQPKIAFKTVGVFFLIHLI